MAGEKLIRKALDFLRTNPELKPYKGGSFSSERQGVYNPKFFDLKNENLVDEAGNIIASKNLTLPREGFSYDLPAQADPDKIFRGMSAEEFANFQKNNYLQSFGTHNIGDAQEGLTYFSVSPDEARSYAHNFAPSEFKPDPSRPAYVMAVKRPPEDRIVRVPGTGESEVGVTGQIPREDVTNVYRGNVVDYLEGVDEPGAKVSPRSSVYWEEISDYARGGMAQSAQEEPREDFDKGGAVKKALKAVADLFNTPEMEKWRGKSVIPSSRVEDRYFHGTSKDKDFPQFNVGRHGVWLTKNPEEASEYALQNDSMGLRPGPGWSYEKTNTASRVIPVFARAENPYTGALPDFAMSPNYKRAQSEWFDQLRSQGHDAWLPESNPDLAVILRDPEQIKSAISNTGEFSGPRIDRAEGGEVRDGFDKGGLARRAIDAARRVMGYTDPPTKKIEDWKWRPLSEVDKELGLREIPPHVQNFGDYMREMSDKAGSEGLSARDLIKGFTTTRASIQRQAVDADKLRNLGLDLPSDVSRIRPEGAWAEWLMTPMGQRYLDAAAKGTVEGDAVANAIKIMSPFGRHETDIPDAMRWAAQNLPGREARASDLVARAAQGASSPAEWREFTSDIRGVGPSKSGFLASLYGRGDQPTLDARQIILNTGAPTKEAAKYIARGGGEGGVEAVERLAARQLALGLDAPQKYDPFYQHLAHHAIWDKASNETTTHADVVNAMRNAAIVLGTPAAGAALMSDEAEARERASGGRLLEDEYPTQYLPNVGRQVMADGGSPAAEKYEAMPGFFSRMLGIGGGSEPEADIQRYENRMRAIAQQPEDIRSMTHAPSKPMRPIEIEGGFIGKRQLGEAPYDVAGPLSGMAQAAYSLKTVPFYFTPAAPFAAAADLGEAAIDTKKALNEGDYLGAGATGALGVVAPALAYRRQAGDAVRSGLEAARRFVTGNPGAATAVGAGAATLAPEEAEASKSRMVQQVLDIVRGTTPPPSNKDPRFWHNISSTKLSRPLDEMRAGYERVDPEFRAPTREPSDYEGKALITTFGDPSIGGVRLLSVNEQNLKNPTLMQAGPSFVHGAAARGPDRSIWASDLPMVSALANRAAAAQKAGYEPYLNYVKMGGESPDYSHHVTEPLVDLFRQSKVDKGTVADFDKKMREGFNKDFPPYPDWPGLRSRTLDSYLFETGPGKARTAMAKLMATGEFQKRGMPDVAAVRFAATDPELLNVPNYSSGRMIARMDPEATAIREPAVPHKTYRTQLSAHPEGADPARLSGDVPLEISHYDWVQSKLAEKPNMNPSQLQYTYTRSAPTLYMTPETVDRMSTFLDLKKRGLIP